MRVAATAKASQVNKAVPDTIRAEHGDPHVPQRTFCRYRLRHPGRRAGGVSRRQAAEGVHPGRAVQHAGQGPGLHHRAAEDDRGQSATVPRHDRRRRHAGDGRSNNPFYYEGSAYIYGNIGKAFANAMAEMITMERSE